MKKLAILLPILTSVATAEEPAGTGFGSPNAVENQIFYDFGETWAEWKQSLKDDYGLVLNVDYTGVISRWARSAMSACRSRRSTTPTSAPRIYTGANASTTDVRY